MNQHEYINKKDAALYVDVYCHGCKKLMAMSSAITFGGRYYCANCSPYNTDYLFDLVYQGRREVYE